MFLLLWLYSAVVGPHYAPSPSNTSFVECLEPLLSTACAHTQTTETVPASTAFKSSVPVQECFSDTALPRHQYYRGMRQHSYVSPQIHRNTVGSVQFNNVLQSIVENMAKERIGGFEKH